MTTAGCSGILIIEDELAIREALQQLLLLEGYEVHTANNGEEGLHTLKRIPPPCVILLDILMPVMNGWKFLEAREQCSSLAAIPVAIVSGVAEAPTTLPRSTTFIKKPINFDALMTFIHEQCGPPGRDGEYANAR